MQSTTLRTRVLRVSPSRYWSQYWNSCVIGSIATLQLILSLVIVGMEIGNALVDLYKANVYSGFWSFPFILAAAIATYASVCSKKTQTKAAVAVVFQSVAIPVLLVVIAFLMAFVATNFTLCLGFQCSQTSTTFVSDANQSKFTFSTNTYNLLKRVFIVCELVCALIFIQLSIVYIVLFVKCLKKLPHIHPVIRPPPIETAVNRQSVSSIRSLSTSITQHVPSAVRSQRQKSTSKSSDHYQAQKICPECGHASPYIPAENVVECPKCHYRSPFVEHAQQY